MSHQRAQGGAKVPTFESLRFANFRLFWTAMALCTAGQALWRGTQSWQVLQLTNSAFLLGLTGFMTSIPSLALSPFAGAISDRVQSVASSF